MIFRTPKAYRVFPNALTLFLIGELLLSVGPSLLREAKYGELAFWICLNCVAALILAHIGGSQELEVDLARRTYRGVRRWLWFTQVRSGSLDDVAGVSVEGNIVCLRATEPPPSALGVQGGRYMLGKFDARVPAGARAQAEAMARRVASKMGLGIIAWPPR